MKDLRTILFFIGATLWSLNTAAQNDSLARAERVDSLIASADSAFAAKNYPEAKTIYWQAHTLNPNHVYVAEKIRLCDEELARRCSDKGFLAAIKAADSLFLLEKYTEARLKYQEALALRPAEDYPQQQIRKCNEALKEN